MQAARAGTLLLIAACCLVVGILVLQDESKVVRVWKHRGSKGRHATFAGPKFNASCRVLRWQMAPNNISKQIPPLVCSTGGYDWCPPKIKCDGPSHNVANDFDVTFLDTASTSPSVLPTAHVVILSSPLINNALPTRFQNQSWTVVAMESGAFHPKIRTMEFIRHFNFSMGFRNGFFSHPLSYILSDPKLTFGRGAVPWDLRNTSADSPERIPVVRGPNAAPERAVAVSLHSSMQARLHILQELSRYVPTHHMGAFLKNRPGVQGRFDSEGPRNKIAEFSKTAFALRLRTQLNLATSLRSFLTRLRLAAYPCIMAPQMLNRFGSTPTLSSTWPNSHLLRLRESTLLLFHKIAHCTSPITRGGPARCRVGCMSSSTTALARQRVACVLLTGSWRGSYQNYLYGDPQFCQI